jgi:hypothetical protein
MGLNMNEYALMDIIYRNQTHPEYSNDGWCDKSTSELGEWIGISKGGIHQILVKMEKCGYLEIDPSNTKKRKTTEYWYQNAYRKLNTSENINTLNTDKKANRSENERSENERNRSESERCRIESERNRSESERHNKEEYNIINNNKIESKHAHTKNQIEEPSEIYSKSVKSDSEKKEKSSAQKEKKEAYGSEGNVMLTPEEYEKLKSKDEDLHLIAIDKVGLHKKAKGTKYKSDYAAILNWGFKAAMEENIKIQKLKNEYSKSNNYETDWQRIGRERSEQRLRDKFAGSGIN